MKEFEEKVIEGLAKIISLFEGKKTGFKKMSSEKKYSIANKPCNMCAGLISWDGFDKKNPTLPIHVDKSSFIIEDGSCPDY